MPFSSVQSRFVIDGAPVPPATHGSAFYQDALAAITAIYDGSPLAAAAMDAWLASHPGQNIQIQFLAGTAQSPVAPGGSGIVQIDPAFFKPNYYISTNGVVSIDTFVSGLAHEIGHAVTGMRDNDRLSNMA